MKKNLLALAVLAASGVASAQSTVTIYGLVDAYVGSTKVKVSAGGFSDSIRQTEIGGPAGGIQTSRLGFKGSEDLGSGLKANFVLESGFDSSTGAGSNYTSPFPTAITPTNPTGFQSSASVFSRQSWVGLSGGFGEVKLGKMWTPFDEVKGTGAAAFDANVFAPATYVWQSNGYQDRPGNSIYYSTPNIAGFTAAASYSFGENKTATVDAGAIVSANLQYAAGPVAVALSYQKEKETDASPSTKFTQLNGSYDLGVAKILAAFGRVKEDGAKATEYQIGADFPVTGAFTVSAGYARSKLKDEGFEATSKGFGLGGLYALSKRTNLYVGVNSSKSEATGAEVKVNVYVAGVRHTF